MRDRYRSMVATIATGAMLACGDAAVGDVTAPPLAATPAPPVSDTWPTIDEVTNAGLTGSTGLSIILSPRFENDYQTFAVGVQARFSLSNEVGVTAKAWLINKSGATLNSGSGGIQYRRLALPKPYTDTTFTIRISTNGFTCDLIGKSSAEGYARFNALNANLVQIVLYEQAAPTTNGADVPEPACGNPIPTGCEGPATRVVAGATGILKTEASDCDDAPAPPEGGGGGGDTVEICYTIWREYWMYDLYQHQYVRYAVVPIGSYCETVVI
jgi:hypothetical protein